MRPVESAYTLGDLLEQDALALQLLTGGEAARRRRVAGAHSIEIEQPSRWLAPDWLMLTTGVRLRGNVQAQRALVAELAEAGVGGLGFGLELVFKHVPAALLDEAEARDFPVFAVPLRTPFREIVTAINRALLSSDLRTFQRLSAMQLYLLDALDEDDPRGTVLRRLAGLLDAAVVVVGAGGAVQASVGAAPAARLAAAVRDRPAALQELQVDGWHAVAVPFHRGDAALRQWVVVACEAGGFASALTKPVTQAAAPLLAATDRIDEARREQARAVRAAALEDLLEGGSDSDARALRARAAAFGVDFREPARIAVVASRESRSDGAARPAEATVDGLERVLAAAGAAHLTARRQHEVVVLAQVGASRLAELLDPVLGGAADVVAGIGRPVDAVERVPVALRDARLALRRLAAEPQRQVLAFEAFELGLALVSEVAPERVAPQVDGLLSPLRANPLLMEAVVAYFDSGLDVVRAAHALHLHPNSLRYRLARVEELLGGPLRRPATIASLHLALLAAAAEDASMS